jgi:hypothetical protein
LRACFGKSWVTSNGYHASPCSRTRILTASTRSSLPQPLSGTSSGFTYGRKVVGRLSTFIITAGVLRRLHFAALSSLSFLPSPTVECPCTATATGRGTIPAGSACRTLTASTSGGYSGTGCTQAIIMRLMQRRCTASPYLQVAQERPCSCRLRQRGRQRRLCASTGQGTIPPRKGSQCHPRRLRQGFVAIYDVPRKGTARYVPVRVASSE